jgi:hypothetical protein
VQLGTSNLPTWIGCILLYQAQRIYINNHLSFLLSQLHCDKFISKSIQPTMTFTCMECISAKTSMIFADVTGNTSSTIKLDFAPGVPDEVLAAICLIPTDLNNSFFTFRDNAFVIITKEKLGRDSLKLAAGEFYKTIVPIRPTTV